MKKPAVLLLFTLFILYSASGIAENYRVVKGERPPIDYKNLSEDAYEKGIIVIRFREEMDEHLKENPPRLSSRGYVKFNIEMLDSLNAIFGVKSAKQYFLSGALKNTFSEKHRAWGFHLWYCLEVSKNADIPEMIRQYSHLRQVEVAEAVFKKQLTGSGSISEYNIKEESANESQTYWIPDDPQFPEQWHYHNIGQQEGTPGADISLPEAWDLQKGNPLVIVAVEDGGIDYDHEDLAGNMWESIGYNFVNNSSDVIPHNHGTHVAGTIAAVNNNNIGVSGIAGGSGLNDGVRLMSCQVFTENSNNGFHLAPIYAADNGAAISQNSWGYTSAGVYEQNVLDAIDYFNVNGGGDAMDGGITIFSAGNDDSSADHYPGYYSGTFSVASTNNQDIKSWYSNFGSWVDISAPGGETSTVTQRGVLSTLIDNSYGFYQGTSMACPHVSGVVALMLSEVFGELSAQDIKDILLNTADDHYGVNAGYAGQLGTGRINAYNAVALAALYLTLPGNPVDFQAQAVSDSQINLSWQLNDENNQVILAFSPHGSFGIPQPGEIYLPGEEIPGGGSILYKGSSESFIHDGLQAATRYYYRIWSVDSENNYSLGRGTNERTQCGVSPIPFSESFSESGIPWCWEFPEGQGNWEITTSEGQPAPALEFSWSPTLSGYSFSIESPPLDGSSIEGEIILQFDLMLDNYSSSTLEEMRVQISDGPQWIDLGVFNNASGDIAWGTSTINIGSYINDSPFIIRFLASGEDSYNINEWVIDNFSVISASCIPPSGVQVESITANSALLQWQSIGSETEWELVYGPLGFDPDSQGTSITGISQQSFLLSGLQGASTYHVYVRSYCGASGYSLWSQPASLTTLCDIVNLPFDENFQGSTVSCWSFPQGQANWSFGSSYPPPSSQSGAPFATFSWSPSLENYSYSITSPILKAWGNNNEVKADFILFLNNYNNSSLEQMAFEYKTTDSQEWLLISNYDNTGLGSSNVEHIETGIVIPGVEGKEFQIRFRAHGEESYSINGWSLDDINIYQDSSPILLDIKVIAEGAFNLQGGALMDNNLALNDLIPLIQPYGPGLPYHGNENPIWFYEGEESLPEIPDNMVDWVILEIRDATSPQEATASTVVARKPCLLLNSGEIVSTDGSYPEFDIQIDYNLFIVVYHRNHLPVMSAQELELQEGIYSWDFTSESDKAWTKDEKSSLGQGQKYLGDGYYGMYGGDAIGNGQVQTQDKNDVWAPQSGSAGYKAGDFDMNGQVQAQDKNLIWEPNSGTASLLP